MTEKKTPRKSATKKTVAKKSQDPDKVVDQPVDLSDHPAVQMGLIKNPGQRDPQGDEPTPARLRTVPGNPKRGDGSPPET